jgi:hypothetical protein
MAEPRKTARQRLLTGLGTVLSAIGIVALFGIGATGALLLHLNLPASRRVTADAVSQLLANLLQGHLSIGSLSRVRPYEVVAEDIVVRDAARRIVLKVTRLSARADLLDILKRVLRGDAKLTITINHVRIERAEANIIPDAEGIPTIAEAFTPRPTPPGPPTPDRGEYVRVWLPAIELGEGFARGNVAGSPTLEADVSGVHGSVLVTPKGAAIDISRFALVTKGVGGTDARGIASLHIRAPGAVWGSLDGYLGDVQFGGTVRYDDELDVKLNVPRADPGAVRALTGTWPLLVPSEARIRLKGKPPDLNLDLNSTIGDGSTLAGSGALHLAEPISANLELEGRALDLRALWPSAPATAMDVDTGLALNVENGRPVVSVGGTLHRTRIERYDIPTVDFSGSTQTGPFVGEAKLHDVGMPVDASFSVFPDGKLEVDAEAKRVDLAKAERLQPYFDGQGNADVKVHAALDHGRLDTRLTLDVRDFNYKNVTLQSGRVVADVRGPVDRVEQLGLNAKLTGKRFKGAGLGFEEVQATARGPLGAPLVTGQLSEPNGPSVDAQATLTVGKQVALRQLSLGVARDGVEIRGDVAELDLSEQRVLLRDLRLRGAAGELDGDAAIDRRELSVSAHGKDVDLSAFSRVLGLPRGTLEGRVGVDLDLVADERTQRGSLELSLQKGAIAQLSGISGQLSAKLADQRLTGSSSGKVETLGNFKADWDGELAGRPVELASYQHAIGSASLKLTDVALDYLGQLLPDAGVDVGGTASLSLQVSRQDGSSVPDVQASAETHDLLITIPRAEQEPALVSRIELLASLGHVGGTGSTTLSFGATRDNKRLLTTTTEMQLDLAAALEGREPLLAQLEQHPLQSKLIVSEIDLETLPDPLRHPGLRGTVRLEGTVRGTARAPVVSLGVRASSLYFGLGDRGEPIDVCATAEYAKANGAFNVGAEAFLPPAGNFELRNGACSGKRFATARWAGLAPLDPKRGYVGWSGSLLASLEDMPLTVVPQLARANMTGAVSGRVLLDRSEAEPRASAELALKGVKVDRLAVGDGSLGLRTSDKRARAEFSLQSGGSSVDGEVNAGLLWSTDLPEVDAAQPIDVALRARRLQASVLEPILDEYVAELRGLVDGNLRVRLDPLAPGATARELSNLGGQVALSDGSFLISGLGFRLREVSFNATATRDGQRTQIDIPAFLATASANADARIRNLSAYVRLQLRGFELDGGQARVSLKALPLVMDGVTRATADANFLVDLQRRPEKMFAAITFQDLHAKLLKQSTRELIELKEHPNVTVVQPLSEPKNRRDDEDVPWHFVIHLGENAKVERSGMLDVRLTGDPNVVLAQSLGVTGSIFLRRGGAVQMLGKVFVIEGGGVIFDSADPKDPRLDVQASWRTPDGDTLFVYVAGTVSKPKLRFDRPDEQAWAMLLGGDASDITLTALDTLLADTPLAGVQVRKTASENEDDEGAIYTASYRLGERVIVEGNYQEAQATGVDSTTAGGVGASVDWRMTKNWSLRGQLGTIGTGVDLVYQYRY